ncbi:MAG: hypothetical protein WCK58_10730, partial [Chloroflexota bacterium]
VQVEGVTSVPHITPPSTDSVASNGGSTTGSGMSLALILLAMAGLIGTVALVTPAKRSSK